MKPGSFTQLYTHLVLAVKFRECLLSQSKRPTLFAFVSGIITKMHHKAIIVNGYSDHMHVFFGQNPSVSVSDTVTEIKKASCKYINDLKWFPGKFQWQDGYGGFSYSKSQIHDVYNYILNQENHHKRISFREEYIKMLQQSSIDFEDQYLFDFFINPDD